MEKKEKKGTAGAKSTTGSNPRTNMSFCPAGSTILHHFLFRAMYKGGVNSTVSVVQCTDCVTSRVRTTVTLRSPSCSRTAHLLPRTKPWWRWHPWIPNGSPSSTLRIKSSCTTRHPTPCRSTSPPTCTCPTDRIRLVRSVTDRFRLDLDTMGRTRRTCVTMAIRRAVHPTISSCWRSQTRALARRVHRHLAMGTEHLPFRARPWPRDTSRRSSRKNIG